MTACRAEANAEGQGAEAERRDNCENDALCLFGQSGGSFVCRRFSWGGDGEEGKIDIVAESRGFCTRERV